jgi:hypothetical protein
MTSARNDKDALWATAFARLTILLRVSPISDWKTHTMCVCLPGVYNGFFTSRFSYY